MEPRTYRTKVFKAFLEELDYDFDESIEGMVRWKDLIIVHGWFGTVDTQTHNRIVGINEDGELVDLNAPFTGSGVHVTSAKQYEDKLYVARVRTPSVSGSHRVQIWVYDGETWESISDNSDVSSSTTSSSFAELWRFNDTWYVTMSGTASFGSDRLKKLVDGTFTNISPLPTDMELGGGVFGNHLYLNGTTSAASRVIRIDNNDTIEEVSDARVRAIVSVTDKYLYFTLFTGSETATLLGEPIDWDQGVFAWDGEQFHQVFDTGDETFAATSRKWLPGKIGNQVFITWILYDNQAEQADVYLVKELDNNQWNIEDIFPIEGATTFGFSPSTVLIDDVFLVSSPTQMWGDLLDFDLTLEFDVPLLPSSLAIPEEQIRVLHNQTELSLDEWTFDGTIIVVDVEPEFGDTLLAMRETRWDKSWVEFTDIAPIKRETDLTNWYLQRLFIFQELCDIHDIAEILDWPIPGQDKDKTPYRLFFEEGDGPFNITDLPLIEPWLYLPHTQLAVGYVPSEEGENDDLFELEFNFDHASLDPGEWSINDDGDIVLGAAIPDELTLVVERRTNLDNLLIDTQDASRFSSVRKRILNNQIQFLWEESCVLPVLPDGHPLANRIFPSLLNWVTFVGPGSIFTFDKFHWHPDMELFVFVNDILIQDWTIDWPSFTITLPELGEGDTASIGTGSPLGGGATLLPPILPSKEEDDDESASRGALPTFGPVERWGVPEGFATIAPFGFNFINFGPGWQGETGFGPAGWVTGRGFGYRWDHPDGERKYIEIGKNSSAQTPEEWPSGLGRWTRLWSYNSNDGGVTWSHSHTLTQSVSPIAPGWVGSARTQLMNALPPTHPLWKVLLSMYNALGSTDETEEIPESMQNAITQWVNLLKSVDPEVANVTNLTQEDFEDWYDL